MRLFVGVTFSQEFVSEIIRVQELCEKRLGPALRPTRAEQLHLTLKFLGHTEEQTVPELSAALGSAAATLDSIPVVLGQPGVFPPRGSPRILWVGVTDENGALLRLAEAVERACEALGFPREERPFHPHITFARAKDKLQAERVLKVIQSAEHRSVRDTIGQITLFCSEPLPQGSRYSVVSRYGLR